ncbi:MAG: M55 family metallopeptidase [Desulfurococcaceae archaeon]
MITSGYCKAVQDPPALARLEEGEERTQKAVAETSEKLKKREVKALKAAYPAEVKIRFLGTEMADIAELLPIIERIDGKTVKYMAKDIVEAYKILELLVAAAPKLYPYSVMP